MEIGSWEQVENILKTATSLDSRNGAAWFHLGMFELRDHAYHRADDCFKKACKLQPEVVEHWTERGSVNYLLKNWTECKEYSEKAAEIQRTPRILQFLGLALVELEQQDEGMRVLQEAYVHAPDDRQIQFALGITLFRLGRTQEALSLLQQSAIQRDSKRKTEKRRVRDALDIGKDALESWVVLADIFERQERRWETIVSLEIATRVMPKNAQAWYELSQVHIDYNQYENAVEKAYLLDDKDPNILCEQGILFYDAGLKKEALDFFEIVVAKDPDNDTALHYISDIEELFEELEQDGHAPYLGEYGYNAAYDDYYD